MAGLPPYDRDLELLYRRGLLGPSFSFEIGLLCCSDWSISNHNNMKLNTLIKTMLINHMYILQKKKKTICTYIYVST